MTALIDPNFPALERDESFEAPLWEAPVVTNRGNHLWRVIDKY